MSTNLQKIDSILISEDIEGLIEMGAPADEYSDEAAQIVATLEAMDTSSITMETVLVIVSFIWMKSFELSQEDMALRLSAIKRISHNIFLLYNSHLEN